MSVQILTDSTSDILPEEAEQKGVRVVPLLVNFGEEAFRENVEITHQEYFRRLAQAESLPTTSQPTPQDFLAHFEQVQDAGTAWCVCCWLPSSAALSRALSCQGAQRLRRDLYRGLPAGPVRAANAGRLCLRAAG